LPTKQVSAFKVNTEDVFKRWSKTLADLKEEIQTLQIQREEVSCLVALEALQVGGGREGALQVGGREGPGEFKWPRGLAVDNSEHSG
jgi:hypothetical protein